VAGLRHDIARTSRSACRGYFEDFLRHLLALESGLDPALFDWYVQHYHTSIINYPKVIAVGRVMRDDTTGIPVADTLTVREYFETLGVAHMFDPASRACIARMQFGAINPLGFIGYQIGEAILVSTGYYVPEQVSLEGVHSRDKYDAYYVGYLPNDTWRGGRRMILYGASAGHQGSLATDVNAWRGTFTGKNGICSLDDLRTRQGQQTVIRDIIAHNYIAMRCELFDRGADFKSALLARSSATSHFGGKETMALTMSGLLAAAHLCGASATTDFLLFGTISSDEFGASVLDYAMEFSGYCLPYSAT
jgi:hypothetical protein